MGPTLDPLIHQQTRLQILACLYRNRQASFTDLRDGLGLTPGNLQSHVTRLEEGGYVKSGRVLVDLSFEVRYKITPKGAEAFRAYLDQLQGLLQASMGVLATRAPLDAASRPADVPNDADADT
jgi:DNA-binding MarR family transcriptional regulator